MQKQKTEEQTTGSERARQDLARVAVEGAVRLRLANVGSASSHFCQRVGNGPAQLSNRFIGEHRPRL